MADIDGAQLSGPRRGHDDDCDVPRACSDHQGQPGHGCRRRLDQQGRSVPGRLRAARRPAIEGQISDAILVNSVPILRGARRIFASIRKTAMTDAFARPPEPTPPPAPRNFFFRPGDRHPPARHDRRLRGDLPCLQFPHRGRFLTPRNIFNLTIQTVSVAIMATGMVFVIVTRHIDLSVGSLLATCSAMMAMTQTWSVPNWLGLGLGNPLTAHRHRCRPPDRACADRRVPGLADRLSDHPAFIVTLGGLLVWRNVAWYLTKRPDHRAAGRELSSCSAASTARLGETGPGSSAVIAMALARSTP
jgi:hypothetical protein